MFNLVMKKLELFCEASGSKISIAKSILLGWEEHPPNWCTKFGFSWSGSNKITRYIGIPFSIDPCINDMWNWIKDKIIAKLNNWNSRYLLMAGRIQILQKILAS